MSGLRPANPHQLEIDGWCVTHEAFCDVDWEAEEYITDPITDPMEFDGFFRGGLPGEQPCAVCGMPCARVGDDHWGHTRQGVPPGGHHQARPVVNRG